MTSLRAIAADLQASEVAAATAIFDNDPKANLSTLMPKLWPRRSSTEIDETAFRRNAAPIAVLAAFYSKIVVYVPPVAKDEFERRMDMQLDAFVELCSEGVIVPTIGQPRYYSDREDMRPLLELRPTSPWARFDTLCERYNRESFFEPAHDLFKRAQLASLPWASKKWSAQFPHLSGSELADQIARELANSFANMCLLGHHELAGEILSTHPPETAAGLLVALNELLVYPKIIGMGGIPNYDDKGWDQELGRLSKIRTPPLVANNAGNLVKLLEGCRIKYDSRATVEEIVELATSDEAKKLRELHRELVRAADTQKGAEVSAVSGEYLRLVRGLNRMGPIFDKRRALAEAVTKWFSFSAAVATGAATVFYAPMPHILASLALGAGLGQATAYVLSQFKPEAARAIESIGFKSYELRFWEIRRSGTN